MDITTDTDAIAHSIADTTADNPGRTLAPRLGADDPRRHFAAAVDTATQLLATIGPEQYTLATPCEGMSVAGMQEHLVMVLRRVACAGRDEPIERWPADAADVPVGEWPDAWRSAARDVHAAWSDDVLDRPTALPWGTFTGVEVLGVYANEISVHTWDLAAATGLVPVWDTPALEFSLEAIHQQLPMADRTPMWEATRAQLPEGFPWEDPFGPAVPVADDAPLIDRLVAWNGRRPAWRG